MNRSKKPPVRSTKPLLVIVTGPPAVGKTTVGRRLARALCFPFIHKDGIKETLFDSLGWQDREWSRKLGLASLNLLHYLIKVHLRAGRSLVVESNFHPEFATGRFLRLKHDYSFEFFQILCTTSSRVLAERFQERAASGLRHPGHVDQIYLKEEFDADALCAKFRLLDIGGRTLTVDTTDFKAIDFDGLCQTIASAAGD